MQTPFTMETVRFPGAIVAEAILRAHELQTERVRASLLLAGDKPKDDGR